MENDNLDHTAGIEVEKIDTVPPNMVSFEIPAQEYAVFDGTFATIMDEIMSYEDWWQESGYKRSGGPKLFQFNQVYKKGFDPFKTDASFSFYLPIKK